MNKKGTESFLNYVNGPFLCVSRQRPQSPFACPALTFVPSALRPQKNVSDWKPEIRLPHGSEHVTLSGLEWSTEYEVLVLAENQRGKSQPGGVSFRTVAEPTAIPGTVPAIPPPSIHTEQPQSTRASTVTRERLYCFGSLTLTGCLLGSSWP